MNPRQQRISNGIQFTSHHRRVLESDEDGFPSSFIDSCVHIVSSYRRRSRGNERRPDIRRNKPAYQESSEQNEP